MTQSCLLGSVFLIASLIFAGTGRSQQHRPWIDLRFVAAEPAEAGGPNYGFLIGRYEVRNDQWVAFFNDAQAHLDDERGQYLYFDADSGDVYANDQEQGVIGFAGAGILAFRNSANPWVTYDAFTGLYAVVPGFEGHPATGVSWYGALKYCNWLTLAVGQSASERAYVEGPASRPFAWRPATISEEAWAVRDLTAAERTALLRLRGFRLPMDGGDGGREPGVFNEWYKAAAWNPRTGVHYSYGFGRDSLGGADANFRCSGDPFEDLDDCTLATTTPVGFFDGSVHFGQFATRADQNAYGLFDLSGNVWEWVQDQSSLPGNRRNRGGSFRSALVSLAAAGGSERAAGATNDATGFRVVLVQEVAGGLVLIPDADLNAAGVWGGPYSNALSAKAYRVINVAESAVEVSISVDSPWVTLNVPPELSLEPGDTWGFAVAIEPHCDDTLPPGDHEALLTLTSSAENSATHRLIRYQTTEPLSMAPADTLRFSIAYGTLESRSFSYTLVNSSDQAVRWSVRSIETTNPIHPPPLAQWLTINGHQNASGEVSSRGEAVIAVELDTEVTGTMAVGEYRAELRALDECTGTEFSRSIALDVLAPFSLAPSGTLVTRGLCGGIFPEVPITLSNEVTMPLVWALEIDRPDILEIDITVGVLAPGHEISVTASAVGAVGDLPVGLYPVTLTFRQPATGFSIQRVLTIEVTPLIVEPDDGVIFQSPRGGPLASSDYHYTIQNAGFKELAWIVSFAETTSPPSGQNWLQFSQSSGTILDPFGSAIIEVSLSPAAARLPPGTYTGLLAFSHSFAPRGCEASRTMKLRVGPEAFALDMTLIPGEDVQPGGPTHTFRIGRFEVTNAEYVRFLNDALDRPTDARGQFLDHGDPPVGVVRLTGDSTLVFDAGAGAAIQVADGRYEVMSGKEDHPVVGVSWYGAAKLCNWLTVAQGMELPDQRAYHEGPQKADWYPVTADGAALVANVRGFRLPMDGGTGGPSAFNEWHKAAARMGSSATGVPLFGALYGFGRSTLGPADANYLGSADTQTDELTPAGFFDGVSRLADGVTRTRDTSNGYDLYDLCGNAAEWVHDGGNAAENRAIRGGHFNNARGSPFLRAAIRGSLAADSVHAFVGFRVAQALEPAPLEVTKTATRASGLAGGAIDTQVFDVRITNPGPYTHDALDVSIDADWLAVDAVASHLVPPHGTLEIALRIDVRPDSPGVSPFPPSDLVLIPRGDVQQPVGPDYDFWIGRTEVTNRAFADFLNNALMDIRGVAPTARNGRSAHMYFDVDSGNVYINDQQTGAEGVAAPTATIQTKLYDAVRGRIAYVDDRYVVAAVDEDHPVVGVSWYGAVKYCNWRSMNEGIPADLLAYTEAPGPDLEEWRPNVIPFDRRPWIENTIGYRLPMDNEAAGPSPFNEWYKAAAWDRGADEGGGNRGYGFGRDALTPADANFLESGDSTSEGTTPVAFFDGTNTLFQEETDCDSPAFAPIRTVDTGNAYRLYDLCGNVAEWVHDVGDSPDDRATRGGSWRNPADSGFLTNASRGSRPAATAADDLGFRVVRQAGHVARVTIRDGLSATDHVRSFVLDLREPLVVTPLEDKIIDGAYGDHFTAFGNQPLLYSITNRSASSMFWRIGVDQPWLDVAETSMGSDGGEVSAGQSLNLTVRLNALADQLAPGLHGAELRVVNTTTANSETRRIMVEITPPIAFEALDSDPQEYSGFYGGPFENALPKRRFRLRNDASFPLFYDVSADAPWLSVDSLYSLSGTLSPGAGRSFEVYVNQQAALLDVGRHTATVAFAYTDAENGVGAAHSQSIDLVVVDPLIIQQLSEPWHVQTDRETKERPWQSYDLSVATASPVDVSISADQPWLTVEPAFIKVIPGPPVAAMVSINDTALQLPNGRYLGTLQFESGLTGAVQCRTVELDIEEALSIEPFDGFGSTGVQGGPWMPMLKHYRLINTGSTGQIQWNASLRPPGTDWLLLNGASQSSGTLQGDSMATLIVAISRDRAAALPDGRYSAVLEITDLTNNIATTRDLELTIVVPKFHIAEAGVLEFPAQPGGPAYAFRMAKYHTTNAEFAAFLNDAMQNLDNERGQFMFFDTNAGGVHVNSAMTGEIGGDAAARATKLFSPSLTRQIVFASDVYAVVTSPIDYSDHPVAGVSWYGAVKYCNWLTIDQGLSPADRCYSEASDADLAGWRPVIISVQDWTARDLSDAEREELVQHFRGFRLPMDDGVNNSSASTDSPDRYNEWYKAASWNSVLLPPQHTTFGFGRETLTGADANYLNSGDPFDNGTTPVGHFDAANGNAFGLADMTGNVYQWLQDRFSTHPGNLAYRAIRGGSWNDPPTAVSLRSFTRTFTRPERLDGQIGFRVVRTLAAPTGDFDLDGDVDASDVTALVTALSGPAGGVLPSWAVFDFDGDGDLDLSDFARLQRDFSGPN